MDNFLAGHDLPQTDQPKHQAGGWSQTFHKLCVPSFACAKLCVRQGDLQS